MAALLAEATVAGLPEECLVEAVVGASCQVSLVVALDVEAVLAAAAVEDQLAVVMLLAAAMLLAVGDGVAAAAADLQEAQVLLAVVAGVAAGQAAVAVAVSLAVGAGGAAVVAVALRRRPHPMARALFPTKLDLMATATSREALTVTGYVKQGIDTYVGDFAYVC